MKERIHHRGKNLILCENLINESETVLSSLQYRAAIDFIAENNEVGCSKEKKLNIQALINFADNREEDGGFHLIPGTFVQGSRINRRLSPPFRRVGEENSSKLLQSL